MTSDNLPAALFIAALLSHRKDLSARLRSQIISCVPPFDVHSSGRALDGLACAFQASDSSFSPRALAAHRLREAAATSTEWLKRGIFVVNRDELTAPASALHDLPPIFFAKGDPTILSLTGFAILNSRRSRRVTAQDGWIKATKERVTLATEAGGAIVSSFGNLSYSLVTYLAQGFPLILACDDVLPFMHSASKAEQFLSAYGDLFDPALTLLISSFPPGRLPARADRLAERDHLVAALSSVLMVGEVRPSGNMAAILEIASARNIKVMGLHSNKGRANRKQAGSGNASGNRRVHQGGIQESGRENHESGGVTWPEFVEFGSKHSYLIHYTRSCPGPWPGQTMAQYCRSLVDGSETSGHKAFDTLRRILEEKLIRAGNRLIRGSRPVVSLTECMPREISTIVRWRPALIRWNFEPYAIAIRKDALIALGARPVIYGPEEILRKLSEDERFLFQLQQPDREDWTVEKEWRLPGDLLLTLIGHKDLVVIVPHPREAKIIGINFGYKVASAGMGNSDPDGRCTAADTEDGTSHGI